MPDSTGIQRQANQHNVRLASPDEIAHMSDAQSIGKIDELRAAAMRAGDAGDMEASRLYWHNACTIAMFNYVGTDVLAECADFLEAHDLPDLAETYRDYHQQLTGFLGEYNLPRPDYEARLRAENAETSHDRREATHQRPSLAEATAEARDAAGRLGSPAPAASLTDARKP